MTRYSGFLYGLGDVLIIWALDALNLKPLSVGISAALMNLAPDGVAPQSRTPQIGALCLWMLSTIAVGLLGAFWPRA